jgi:hypothetical protein
MSADPMPQGLLAVHDLIREALCTASAGGHDFAYGIALFPRFGRYDARVFGVATSSGESTTLTYRLLRALCGLPVCISGRVQAVIREGLADGVPRSIPAVMLDQPVLRLGLTCMIGLSCDDADRTMPLESLVFAGDLTAPIVLLMDLVPEGWPK